VTHRIRCITLQTENDTPPVVSGHHFSASESGSHLLTFSSSFVAPLASNLTPFPKRLMPMLMPFATPLPIVSAHACCFSTYGLLVAVVSMVLLLLLLLLITSIPFLEYYVYSTTQWCSVLYTYIPKKGGDTTLLCVISPMDYIRSSHRVVTIQDVPDLLQGGILGQPLLLLCSQLALQAPDLVLVLETLLDQPSVLFLEAEVLIVQFLPLLLRVAVRDVESDQALVELVDLLCQANSNSSMKHFRLPPLHLVHLVEQLAGNQVPLLVEGIPATIEGVRCGLDLVVELVVFLDQFELRHLLLCTIMSTITLVHPKKGEIPHNSVISPHVCHPDQGMSVTREGCSSS